MKSCINNDSDWKYKNLDDSLRHFQYIFRRIHSQIIPFIFSYGERIVLTSFFIYLKDIS